MQNKKNDTPCKKALCDYICELLQKRYGLLQKRVEVIKREGESVKWCLENKVIAEKDTQNMINKLKTFTAELGIIDYLMRDLLDYIEKGGISDGKKEKIQVRESKKASVKK